MSTQAEINQMFDRHLKNGADELQKFFDSGGKIDFSNIGTIDEIAGIIKDALGEVKKSHGWDE